MIEEVSCVQRRVTQKLNRAAVNEIRPRLRHHIRKTRCPVPDLRRHHARTRLHFLNRIHVEIRKRRPAQLRIARVPSVDREHRGRTTLSIRSELLRKIRRAIRVGHRTRGKLLLLAAGTMTDTNGAATPLSNEVPTFDSPRTTPPTR